MKSYCVVLTMAVIKHCTGIIVFVCLGFSVVSSRRGYMLTFPEELQIGAPENFCLALHNVSHGVTLNLNISCYGRTAEYQSRALHKKSHECFTWTIPEFLTPGTCELEVQGSDEIGDYKFTERKDVKIVDTHQMTFIQTDKPMYKPGEIVKFRILTVTQDLLPLSQSIDRVTVQDPHGFYMKEWKELPVKSGFAGLEFKLYEKPLLGEWKIEAVVNGRKNQQFFTVEEYVLPKFQVDLDMQDSLTVSTDTLWFEVCSKYTFGKPVEGILNASICLKNTQDSWFCQSNVRPCAKYNSEINGCHEFQIKTDTLKITERRFSLLCQPLLVLDVNVTEKNTGISVHETQTGTGVWEERIKLKFISQKYFKPFFPYHGKILASFPTGRPAPGEEVCVTIEKLAIEKTLVSNSEGLIHFTIQNLTNSVDGFVMNAKSTYKEIVDRKKYTLYAASTKKHVKQWYSPTSSYIHVSTPHKGYLNCGDNVTLHGVYSTLQSTVIQKGYLQVISKGNILQTLDITEIVKTSTPYTQKSEGTVFYPIFSSSIVKDNSNEDGSFSDLGPQGPMFASDGPPGYDKMAPVAPPGSPGSMNEDENENAAAPAETRVPDMLDDLVVRSTTNSLVVQWEPNRRSNIPVRGYNLGYGKGIPNVYKVKLDANTFSYTIENLEPASEYVVSILAFNNIGNGRTRYVSAVTKKDTGQQSHLSMVPPVNLKAHVLSASTVVLTWADPELGQSQRITHSRVYTIRYRNVKVPGSDYKFVNTTDLNCHIDSLQPYTDYTFNVKVNKGQGESQWSLQVITRTKEADLQTAPRDLTIAPVEDDPTTVTLAWQPPAQPNGIITGSLVYYTTDPSKNERDWEIHGVLGPKVSTTISNLTRGATYNFKIQSRNSRGYGPTSVAVVYKTMSNVGSQIPTLQMFTTSIPITHEMAPIVRILVYLVTDQGEMVADTVDTHVKHCDKNKIEMYFTQKIATPGDRVGMVLTAAPNSLCSVAMVDKSVLLHGGSNLVKQTDVLNKLKDLDLTSDFINDWRYCSDVSDMPPLLSPNAPPSRTGPPGASSYTDKEQAPPSTSLRKKRSIQQFHSNMYDSLLAFKVAGVVALTDLDLQTRPCIHGDDEVDDPVGPPYLPGDARWPVPGVEGTSEELDAAEDPKSPGVLKSNLRRTFPETWLWDLHEIPMSGTLTVNHTIGDTITEWVGNAYCSNTDVGLGVSDVVRITGFQSFFMSVKLPYAVIRGEIVNIDVLVFNYLPHCINIQVNLVKNGRFTVEKDKEDPFLCICSRESKSHRFRIRPQVLGAISLTFSGFLREHRITCESSRAPLGFARKQVTDIVVKKLLVQPEGIEVERTSSHYICPKDSVETDNFKMTLSSDLPKDSLVPGSLRGWINVMGDIMGPVLNGLDNLILLPTGCGEQNMVRMAPNIAVLQYLTATRQLADDTETKALDYLNKGYQQQLKFMHPDGSYSAFGLTDDRGSTWLTAFVFKTFRQAMHFIYVDRKQIQTKSWEFLLHQQGADGCFEEKGKVLGKYMMGGVAGSKEDRKRALTAYVLLSMLESFKMMRERTPPFIALAIKCIEVDNLTDPYTLALVSYAMTLYKPDSDFTAMILTRLKEKAIVDGNMMFWRREKKPAILSGQGTAASAEIEMTAYALLALLTVNENVPIKEVIPIVRWLTNQRNAYGGFSSTQDTVVALQALSLFAERIYGDGLDVSVNIATGSGDSLDFEVNTENSILLQQQRYSHPDSDIHVTAKGDGCILLQTTQHYHVLNKVLPGAAFDLNVTTPVTMEILNNGCRSRIVRICVRYTGTDTVSNMVVVETKVLSGWVPDITSLKKVLTQKELGIKLYEIDNRNPDVVNFYFDQLDSSEVCFEFTIVQEMEIDNKQPAVVKVFDYYETELEVSSFYELSDCSEDELELINVNLKDKDLYVEDPDELGEDLNNIYDLMDAYNTPEGAFSDLDKTKVDPNSPGPLGKRTNCPICSEGGSSVLHNICTKQTRFKNQDKTKVDPNSPVSLGKWTNCPKCCEGGSSVHNFCTKPTVLTVLDHPATEQNLCPMCSKGNSSVLHNICTEQIWTTKREGDNLLLRVVAPDSLSPELSIPFPDDLKTCTKCNDALASGQLSLAVLTTIDWQDIGKSFVASDTMILEWTESLQNYLQTVLSKCIS